MHSKRASKSSLFPDPGCAAGPKTKVSVTRSVIFRFFILLYRWFISPALHLLAGAGAGCRFTPTCSQYAEEAFRILPPKRAFFLTLGRVARCHPFSKGGHDPVPPR